jgi:hypothetical protein
VSYLYIFKLLTTCFLINSTAVVIIHQSIVCTIITISSKNTCSITYQSIHTTYPDPRLTIDTTRWRPHSELKLRPKHINLNIPLPHPLHPSPLHLPLPISIPTKDLNPAWRVHLSVIVTGRTVTSMLSQVHDLQPHLPSTTRDQSLLHYFDLLPILHSLHTSNHGGTKRL